MPAATNFISNGGRNSEADIVMDGASQTNQENNSGVTTALYTPPVDAVQEFNVQQNTYSADIGFGGNTVINVVTKSGTNQFHGSLYEFLQNSALNANNWFNNLAGVKISPRKQNQFGGTIRRSHSQGQDLLLLRLPGHQTESQGTARAGVPSAAERQGDFGEVCTPRWRLVRLRGPDAPSARTDSGIPYSSTYSGSAGGAVRSAFIPFNNLLPTSAPATPSWRARPMRCLPGPAT